jgi:hypothetical protein
MKLIIRHQESYSRGELLLRSLLFNLHIIIPHYIFLVFLQFGLIFINIARFWIILFTGKWPKSLFDYSVKIQRYSLRITSRLINLNDGYPEFGLNGKDEQTDFDIEYKESYSRIRLLVRGIFGFFLIIPHIIVLYIKLIGFYIIIVVSWWVVLITGTYPKGMHNFAVGVIRHSYRLWNYLYFLSDHYPSFSNSPVEGEITEFTVESN